jgi:hypothetical protein
MFFGVTSRVPSWAGDFMPALRRLGYPCTVNCRQPHAVHIDMFQAVLKRANALPLMICTSPHAYLLGIPSCALTSGGLLAQLRLSVLICITSLFLLARFEHFSVFVLVFMTSLLMWAAGKGFPALSAVVTCALRLWVMNTTLFFIVWPLLMYGTAIPTYFCTSSRSFSLQQFNWQADLRAVVSLSLMPSRFALISAIGVDLAAGLVGCFRVLLGFHRLLV